MSSNIIKTVESDFSISGMAGAHGAAMVRDIVHADLPNPHAMVRTRWDTRASRELWVFPSLSNGC